MQTSGGSDGLVVPQRPPKAPEAKTFFANERTLLQWVSPVSLILSMAIALTSIGESQSGQMRATMVPVGVAMLGLSSAWLLYALHIYFKRLRNIRMGELSGFDETFGPTLLVMGLLVLCVGSMAVFVFDPFGSIVGSTSTTTSTAAAMVTASVTNEHVGPIITASVSLNVAGLDKLLSDADVQSAIARGIAHIHV